MYQITSDNQQFTILDTETADEKKLWGFMSPMALNIAKNSTHLWVDGTWEIVDKTKVDQLWLIVARSDANKISLPFTCYLTR